jgi:hypothetical protein
MTACTFRWLSGSWGYRARSDLVEALGAAIAQPGTSPGTSLEGSDEPVRRAPRLDEADAGDPAQRPQPLPSPPHQEDCDPC